jgi:hypothetical protein
MDRKVAIVTTWRSDNHGSILQAFALQRLVERWGYDSELIDFSRGREGYSYRLERLMKDHLKNAYTLILRPNLYEIRRKNRTFICGKLKVSPFYVTYDQLSHQAAERYSAAICGSDQIWKCYGGTPTRCTILLSSMQRNALPTPRV